MCRSCWCLVVGMFIVPQILAMKMIGSNTSKLY